MTYAYDWVELPEVEVGDTVRVTYVSGQTDTEQTREGDVIEIHPNGFAFDHDPGGEHATSVREHENNMGALFGVRRDVSTLTWLDKSDRAGDVDGTYVHGAHLNRNHRSREEAEVEVVG